jgi:hypothetical protein
MAVKRTFYAPTPEAISDVWQRQAVAGAIQGVRNLMVGGAIPPTTHFGGLSEAQLGWVVAAAIFYWSKTRAEHATAKGLDIEAAVRQTGLDPEPWDAGAVAAILPQLGALSDIDWSQPLGAWPNDTIVRFLLEAMKLIHTAMQARDAGGGVTNRKPLSEMQRIASAEAGGSLMTPDESEAPF